MPSIFVLATPNLPTHRARKGRGDAGPVDRSREGIFALVSTRGIARKRSHAAHAFFDASPAHRSSSRRRQRRTESSLLEGGCSGERSGGARASWGDVRASEALRLKLLTCSRGRLPARRAGRRPRRTRRRRPPMRLRTPTQLPPPRFGPGGRWGRRWRRSRSRSRPAAPRRDTPAGC